MYLAARKLVTTVTSSTKLVSMHGICTYHNTGVGEINTPFGLAFALQFYGVNCYPAPDSVLRKPISLIILFSRGVFFLTDTGITNQHDDAKWLHEAAGEEAHALLQHDQCLAAIQLVALCTTI